jgi:DNA-directed RNA polymerase specialized sigma24 family protein
LGTEAMSSPGSVTYWIDLLKEGDAAAAQQLWESYFRRLVGLARAKLRGTPRRAADEEDVALSAFGSFCRGVEQGRFPQLLDREDLWQLLVVLTVRKAFRLAQYERRQKRGGGQGSIDNTPPGGEAEDEELPLAQLIGREPTPEFAAQVTEACQRLLARLGSAELRAIALWKLEGYTTEEIAAKQDCAPRTIERKLQRIRGLWAKEIDS